MIEKRIRMLAYTDDLAACQKKFHFEHLPSSNDQNIYINPQLNIKCHKLLFFKSYVNFLYYYIDIYAQKACVLAFVIISLLLFFYLLYKFVIFSASLHVIVI